MAEEKKKETKTAPVEATENKKTEQPTKVDSKVAPAGKKDQSTLVNECTDVLNKGGNLNVSQASDLQKALDNDELTVSQKKGLADAFESKKPIKTAELHEGPQKHNGFHITGNIWEDGDIIKFLWKNIVVDGMNWLTRETLEGSVNLLYEFYHGIKEETDKDKNALYGAKGEDQKSRTVGYANWLFDKGIQEHIDKSQKEYKEEGGRAKTFRQDLVTMFEQIAQSKPGDDLSNIIKEEQFLELVNTLSETDRKKGFTPKVANDISSTADSLEKWVNTMAANHAGIHNLMDMMVIGESAFKNTQDKNDKYDAYFEKYRVSFAKAVVMGVRNGKSVADVVKEIEKMSLAENEQIKADLKERKFKEVSDSTPKNKSMQQIDELLERAEQGVPEGITLLNAVSLSGAELLNKKIQEYTKQEYNLAVREQKRQNILAKVKAYRAKVMASSDKSKENIGKKFDKIYQENLDENDPKIKLRKARELKASLKQKEKSGKTLSESERKSYVAADSTIRDNIKSNREHAGRS